MKKIKMIISAVVCLICFIGIFLYLYSFTNIIIDSSDLYCERIVAYPENKEIMIFKFNRKALIKEYIEKNVLVYETKDEAQSKFSEVQKIFKETNDSEDTKIYYDSKVELMENRIEISYFVKVDDSSNMYKKSKKDLIKIYGGENSYECK